MTITEPAPPATDPRSRFPWRILLGIVVALFAAFWVWALFFASKEAINKIDDRDRAARRGDLRRRQGSARGARRLPPRRRERCGDDGRARQPGGYRRGRADARRRGRRAPTDAKGRRSCPTGRPTTARTSRTAGTTPTSCAPVATRRSRRPPSTASRSATRWSASPATTRCRPAPRRPTSASTHRSVRRDRLTTIDSDGQLLGDNVFTTRAGLPAATVKSGIEPRTTLFAPITT